MSSPYKKMKVANQGWVGYVQMNKLESDRAYRILRIVATNHAEYGPGQQATILCSDGKMWRTQLPGKYLAQFDPEDIEVFKQDISMKKNPYLIYRGKMMDGSYNLDIVPASKEMMELFEKNRPVPELEKSNESNDNGNSSLDCSVEVKESGKLECGESTKKLEIPKAEEKIDSAGKLKKKE